MHRRHLVIGLVLSLLAASGCARNDRPGPPTLSELNDAVLRKDGQRFGDIVRYLDSQVGGSGFVDLATAQYVVGVAYLSGEVVQRDDGEAKRWLERAATAGVAGAQLLLAGFYCEGTATARNYEQCAEWMTKAADHGDPRALAGLARLYADGHGVRQDREEGLRLMTLSAEQGFPPSQLELGVAYATGDGVPEDRIEAYKWFVITAANVPDAPPPGGTLPEGSIAAGIRDAIATAMKLRDETESTMTRAEIAEGQRRAARWHPRRWEDVKPR